MKKHPALFLAAAVMAVCLTSCFKDAILYSGTEMCTVLSSTRLHSDSGNILNIKGGISSVPDTLKRIIVDCEITGGSSEYDDEFDVKILSYAPVIIKDVVSSEDSDEEELGNDGVNVQSAWIGGGYLNSFAVVTKQDDSKTTHSVNLVLDRQRSNSDTLYLKYHHNAFGDSFDNPDIDASDIIIEGQYYSFPLEGIIPSGVESIILFLESDWFMSIDGVLHRDKTVYSGSLKYTR